MQLDEEEWHDNIVDINNEVEESEKWLYIENDIIARRQTDGQYWVENGAWEGHINKDGNFICNASGINCGKGILFSVDEMGDFFMGDYHAMFERAEKVFLSLSPRRKLQFEIDNWLGSLRL